MVTLSGELDLASADDLRDRLTATIELTPVVDVDLPGVTFIDSTVISALVAAHHAAKTAGGRLTLINCTGQVRRVLDITGVLPLLGPRRCDLRAAAGRRVTRHGAVRGMFRLAKSGVAVLAVRTGRPEQTGSPP